MVPRNLSSTPRSTNCCRRSYTGRWWRRRPGDVGAVAELANPAGSVAREMPRALDSVTADRHVLAVSPHPAAVRRRHVRTADRWTKDIDTINIKTCCHTWRICAYPAPTSPTGSTYVLLAANSSSFHATVVRNSAVGPSLLLAWWPGMPYRTPLETQPCQLVLSDALWKLSSFLLTSVLAH